MSIFCEAYQLKNGHRHDCTLMAGHTGDHQCLCDSWSSTSDRRIQKWREVAELLEQGWRVDGFDLVSPTGKRRSAWGNAIKACRDRGLIPLQATSKGNP